MKMSTSAQVFVCVAVFGLYCLYGADPAYADWVSTGTSKVCRFYTGAKTVIYSIGGLGVMVCSVFAYFGRIKWGHIGAALLGLFLVATVDQAVQFFGGTSTSCSSV